MSVGGRIERAGINRKRSCHRPMEVYTGGNTSGERYCSVRLPGLQSRRNEAARELGSRQRATATGARARRAPKAVNAGSNPPAGKQIGVEFPYMARQAAIHGQVEHLVEVTIVERAVPPDAHQPPAHPALDRPGIEFLYEQLHVALVRALLQQVLEEPADRHVGERQELVEGDAEARAELPLVVC